MAESTNVILLDPTHCNDRFLAFITQLAEVKGSRIEISTFASEHPPSAIIRGHQVDGTWPIINYLLELMPYPELLPASPAHRAIIRTAVDRVLTHNVVLDDLLVYYLRNNRPVTIPKMVTLLDFALAACTDADEEHPWIEEIRTQLGLRIKEYTLYEIGVQ